MSDSKHRTALLAGSDAWQVQEQQPDSGSSCRRWRGPGDRNTRSQHNL